MTHFLFPSCLLIKCIKVNIHQNGKNEESIDIDVSKDYGIKYESSASSLVNMNSKRLMATVEVDKKKSQINSEDGRYNYMFINASLKGWRGRTKKLYFSESMQNDSTVVFDLNETPLRIPLGESVFANLQYSDKIVNEQKKEKEIEIENSKEETFEKNVLKNKVELIGDYTILNNSQENIVTETDVNQPHFHVESDVDLPPLPLPSSTPYLQTVSLELLIEVVQSTAGKVCGKNGMDPHDHVVFSRTFEVTIQKLDFTNEFYTAMATMLPRIKTVQPNIPFPSHQEMDYLAKTATKDKEKETVEEKCEIDIELEHSSSTSSISSLSNLLQKRRKRIIFPFGSELKEFELSKSKPIRIQGEAYIDSNGNTPNSLTASIKEKSIVNVIQGSLHVKRVELELAKFHIPGEGEGEGDSSEWTYTSRSRNRSRSMSLVIDAMMSEDSYLFVTASDDTYSVENPSPSTLVLNVAECNRKDDDVDYADVFSCPLSSYKFVVQRISRQDYICIIVYLSTPFGSPAEVRSIVAKLYDDGDDDDEQSGIFPAAITKSKNYPQKLSYPILCSEIHVQSIHDLSYTRGKKHLFQLKCSCESILDWVLFRQRQLSHFIKSHSNKEASLRKLFGSEVANQFHARFQNQACSRCKANHKQMCELEMKESVQIPFYFCLGKALAEEIGDIEDENYLCALPNLLAPAKNISKLLNGLIDINGNAAPQSRHNASMDFNVWYENQQQQHSTERSRNRKIEIEKERRLKLLIANVNAKSIYNPSSFQRRMNTYEMRRNFRLDKLKEALQLVHLHDEVAASASASASAFSSKKERNKIETEHERSIRVGNDKFSKFHSNFHSIWTFERAYDPMFHMVIRAQWDISLSSPQLIFDEVGVDGYFTVVRGESVGKIETPQQGPLRVNPHPLCAVASLQSSLSLLVSSQKGNSALTKIDGMVLEAIIVIQSLPCESDYYVDSTFSFGAVFPASLGSDGGLPLVGFGCVSNSWGIVCQNFPRRRRQLLKKGQPQPQPQHQILKIMENGKERESYNLENCLSPGDIINIRATPYHGLSVLVITIHSIQIHSFHFIIPTDTDTDTHTDRGKLEINSQQLLIGCTLPPLYCVRLEDANFMARHDHVEANVCDAVSVDSPILFETTTMPLTFFPPSRRLNRSPMHPRLPSRIWTGSFASFAPVNVDKDACGLYVDLDECFNDIIYPVIICSQNDGERCEENANKSFLGVCINRLNVAVAIMTSDDTKHVRYKDKFENVYRSDCCQYLSHCNRVNLFSWNRCTEKKEPHTGGDNGVFLLPLQALPALIRANPDSSTSTGTGIAQFFVRVQFQESLYIGIVELSFSSYRNDPFLNLPYMWHVSKKLSAFKSNHSHLQPHNSLDGNEGAEADAMEVLGSFVVFSSASASVGETLILHPILLSEIDAIEFLCFNDI